MPSGNRTPRRVVITIDGPAGSGKSTVARGVAAALGIQYLDTGAMYRGLTVKALRLDIDPEDGRALARLARTTRVDWRHRRGTWRLVLDGQDVSRAIRTPQTTQAVSAVSRHPAVRHWMVRQQRRFARAGSVVMEGRDIGSVVFPRAPHKFFLTASAAVRARRRQRDLRAAGVRTTLAAVEADLTRRDAIDSHRAVSPLVCPRDAVRVDTSRRTAAQTLRVLLDHITQARRSRRPH